LPGENTGCCIRENVMSYINEDLFRFQAALSQAGLSFEEFIRDNYIDKWLGDNLFAAMSIRTTMVTAIHNFLVDEGILPPGDRKSPDETEGKIPH